MDRGLLILEKYIDEFVNNPGLRYEAAVTLLRLGRIQQCLGRSEAAETHYRRALPMWEALSKKFPDEPIAEWTAGCLQCREHRI